MNSAPTLELRDIRKSFGELEVIHGIDLQIHEGEFVVFVGPSGCGKSTLLRLIAGLEDPTSGDVNILGNRVNDKPSSDRGLAMVFQSYALYPHMSVRKNLSFGLENTNMPRAEIEERVQAAASLLQIEQLLERRPGQLSGGQRQRVAIGRAIVREPVVFLFDEPLSNLDAELRMQMRVEISNLHAQLSNTMIYVTHDQVEAMTMADRIVVLRGGNVEQVGKPLELYNHPANKFVAGFIGAPRMNFVAGRVRQSGGESVLTLDAGYERVIATDLQLPDGYAVTVGVRPEAIHVSLDGDGDIEVGVENFEQLGAVTYIYTVLSTGEKVTVQLPRQVALTRGQKIHITFPKDSIHLFSDEDEAAIPFT
ncbi:ABC transporter ATP-binding protein [Halovulum sp. GXIMD14794]